MEQLIIGKSKQRTPDGYNVYNFEHIPQGYIKIYGLFKKNDADAIKTAEKLAGKNKYDFRIVEGA